MFDLTEEQIELRDLAQKVARERYAPLAKEMDHDRTHLPVQERKFIANLGLLALSLPEEYGGGGRPLYDALIVQEQFAKANPQAAWPIFEASVGPVRVIDLFGTDEQKQQFLPPIASGDKTLAIAISEPDAGSAATDVSTRARVDGGKVVINGAKRWSSGAGVSEQYLVYVRLSDSPGGGGMGAVVVDKDTPGLTFGPQEELMGHRGIGSADMFFDEVVVPVENLIVHEGGFNKLFTAFSIERLGNSTMCLAIAQEALDRTATYVLERKQFGKPIIDFQTVQTMLADMVIQVDAARLLIQRAAVAAGTGAPKQLDASIAKCYANEMVKRVTDLAMQAHGGYGYSEEYEIARMYRDAAGWAIAGGTPAMQRTRIASEYVGRRFNQRG
ncbi:butyryl-CoA dehydrogenase [Mycolicibacterium fortuitum]|uniref:Butyryl-CoA dehydrogenase n=1 Tax=Mycolicibacterium fortuitum TaxID=1766 RepID=A0ABD6QCT0_MYCFO|nr:acyl-CoA dehydrogenase family protein [Mycolicibacterium fortuitum]OMC33124.1 butyryl-CoA dehydrogenase [Mycolicibacterium fortuitum]